MTLKFEESHLVKKAGSTTYVMQALLLFERKVEFAEHTL
jgi:hypothetical protein